MISVGYLVLRVLNLYQSVQLAHTRLYLLFYVSMSCLSAETLPTAAYPIEEIGLGQAVSMSHISIKRGIKRVEAPVQRAESQQRTCLLKSLEVNSS
jgi:hypothetical protein